MSGRGAAALVFCTSAAVLVLEILAGRLLAPYVGVSIETYTGIIGTVLAGIALGSAVGGRLADRRDPRRLLGPVLVLGGALSLASLAVVSLLGPVMATAGGGPVAIVLLALGAFFLPSAVLSTVTPMAAKLRLADLGEAGAVVGGLSAAGTAGALVGTFATGFFLVATLPSRPIVLAVGSALVVAGLALWLRLAPRPPSALALVGVLVAAGSGATATGPCETETAYYCARIEADDERPSGRSLFLDTLRHSYVDLDDPAHLEFRYTRLFAAVVDVAFPDAGPVDALHLGGGGFSFPRWLAATHPGSRSTVIELDPTLVDLAEDELGLVRGLDLRVEVGDARLAIEDEVTDGVDLVVGDAFGSLSVPWHLTTVELVEEVDRVLRDGGVYVLNVIDGGAGRFVEAEVATLAEVFAAVVLLSPPEASARPQNSVLVASDRPLDLTAIADDEALVVAGAELDDIVEGNDPLTDDFAPVDTLLSRR